MTLASNMPSLNMNFGGASITVALAANGAITVTPAASGLVTRWESATATTGRLVLEYDSDANALKP